MSTTLPRILALSMSSMARFQPCVSSSKASLINSWISICSLPRSPRPTIFSNKEDLV